jgi:ABC-type transport system involved in multi-copper enzyme maturation permease subunit
MTADTAFPATPRPAAPSHSHSTRAGDAPRVTFTRVMRSEWTKLTSLRSTVWSMVVAVLLVVGLGVLFTGLISAHWDHMSASDIATFDPTTASETGMFFAQLAVGVLGVMVMTGEYSTGMIRSSFGAVPRRLPVLGAKAVVFGVFSFVLMFVSLLVTFLIGQVFFQSHHVGASLTDDGVLRSLLGVAFYLAAIGLIGMFLGTMLRATGGAIAVLVALVLIVPIVFATLPGTWSDQAKWLPSNAGGAMASVVSRSSDTFSPQGGLVLLLAYVAVTGAAAAWLLLRRDA